MAKLARKDLSDVAAEVTAAEKAAANVSADTSAEKTSPPAAQGMKRPKNRKREPKSRLNVNLDTALYDRFQALADREGGSMTFLVTQYVKAAVDADDALPWR